MKAAKLQSLIVFAILALMLTACSMEASIQNLVPDISILKAAGQAHGITSGSGQMQVTNTGTYKVSASVGVVGATNNADHGAVYSTSGGYKVFGTVQGAIVSE